MNCNIDGKGRKVRAIGGICCLIVGGGFLLSALVWRSLLLPLAITGAFVVLAGAFQIFESRKGWCALRAMGIKTRL
jgi:uncharacterized membrane protein